MPVSTLTCTGTVIPSSTQKLGLVAHHADGSRTTGEVRISRSNLPIHTVEVRPDPEPISADVREAIAGADLCIFGPGSLFTSVIPNLLVPGMVSALRACAAPRVYVANVMTQPGETDGYTLSDHVEAIERHAGEGFITAVVANASTIPEHILARYRAQGSEPVVIDRHEFAGVPVYEGDLVESGRYMRHSPERLAKCIIETFWQPGAGAALSNTTSVGHD